MLKAARFLIGRGLRILSLFRHGDETSECAFFNGLVPLNRIRWRELSLPHLLMHHNLSDHSCRQGYVPRSGGNSLSEARRGASS